MCGKMARKYVCVLCVLLASAKFIIKFTYSKHFFGVQAFTFG